MMIAVLGGCMGGDPQITVNDAQLVPSQMFIGRGSAFMKIVNNGTGSDTLLGCAIKELPSVRGEIHEVAGGKMAKIEKIDVSPRHSAELQMGSHHLMFFGLPEKIDQQVTILLQFQKSGQIEVTAPVVMMSGNGHTMNH